MARDLWSELLWSAWGALGVESWTRAGVDGAVDPEALMVATLQLGDERLLEAVGDWIHLHDRLVMGRRLGRIAGRHGIEDDAREWLTTSASPSHVRPKASLFDSSQPGALALRLRAVAGATGRTEIIRALHPVVVGQEQSVTASELGARVALTRSQLNAALDDLVGAGVVERFGSERRRSYAPVNRGDVFAQSVWDPWRSLRYVPWTELPSVLGLVRRLTATPGGYEVELRRLQARDDALRHPLMRWMMSHVVAQPGSVLEQGASIRSSAIAAQGDAARIFTAHLVPEPQQTGS